MWRRLSLLLGTFVAVSTAPFDTSGEPPLRACEKHEAKGPCTTERFVYARVAKGCEDNGRRGAASAMRMMMLKANQKRAGLTCTSCHDDPDAQDFDLRDGAHDLAAKWFAGEARAK